MKINFSINYKGYTADVSYEPEDKIYVGEVRGISDSLNFHGRSILEINTMFHQSIENYLDLCKQIGKDPERAADYKLACRIYTCISDNTDCMAEPEANDPSSQVKGGLSNDSWGGYREYPTTYAGRTGAAVTTNGSYFSYDSGQPVCAGCFIKGGKILKDGVTNGKEICLDNTGKFYTPSAGISASTLLASGVKDIWGTADPLLIQDGQKVDLANQQKINNTYYNRTAIGMVQPGEYYMITAGTAQYKNGLSFAELQSIFANLGCTYARSMDGGGSSSLVVNGKLLNTPAQYDERPVVDFLSFLP